MGTVSTRDSEPVAELRAVLDLTNSLLSAVSQHDPLRALVSRVAALSHGTCVVYDTEGHIVASAGEAPTQLIWNEIAATNVPNLRFQVGRYRVLTRTLGLYDGVHVLAVATRELTDLPLPEDLFLDTAERMLDAVNGIQHGASQRNRRDNEQLLAELQDGVLPSREHRYWSRLNQFSFAGYAPLRAFEAASPTGDFDAEGHLQHIAESARAAGIPLLVTLRRPDQSAPATVNGLVPDLAGTEPWLDRIAETLLVGCSAPTDALSEIPDAFRQAESGLLIARQRDADTPPGSGPGVIRMDAIDLLTWSRSQVAPQLLEARSAALLAPIVSVPHLVDTLVTYLALDQTVAAAAEALFVHQNTVRYRLSRVEELLGGSLDSAPVLANLTLALHNRVLGRRAELR